MLLGDGEARGVPKSVGADIEPDAIGYCLCSEKGKGDRGSQLISD